MIKDAFNRFMARKSFEGTKLGDWDYSGSCMGNVRQGVFGLLVIYVSRYLDLWLQLVWRVRGEENHLIYVGKMQFHARVGYIMGLIALVGAVASLYYIYRQHRQLRNRAPLTSHPSQEALDAEIALRLKEQSEERARHGFPELQPIPHPTQSQRLKNFLWRFPLLHDFLWGWPFMLGLSLVFLGKTLDGSPSPGLNGIFTPPGLDFFVLAKTPASAMNGLFIGAAAYIINHVISKTPRLPLWIKLLISLLVGVFACWAWYVLTMKMGAPI
jgi:hypothetical protein